MSNLNDDDITTHQPTQSSDDQDAGGSGPKDTEDLPTERDDDLDQVGEGDQDSGDEA